MLAAALLAASRDASAQGARDSVVPVHEIYASCAGDGMPPPAREHANPRLPAYSLQLSALAQAWGAAWAGRDVRQTDLDAVDGAALYFGVARLGACGLLRTPSGPLSWSIVYEPYSLDESAHPDHRAWGRIASAEIGFAPFRWLTVSAGIRKIAFSYGHDEPLELRVLPIIPYVSQSVAPDRRAGITLDDDFGAAHVVIGVYEGARDLRITTAGGMLLAARLVAEPIGPVGNTVSTRGDPELWRGRPRFAVNASILYQYANGASNYALAADGALHWGPVGLAGEYVYASNTTVEAPVRHLPFPSPSRQGMWVEAAVMLWRPWIEASARYDWLDNPPQAGQRFHAVTAGVDLYGRKLLKLQLLYTHKFHYGAASAGAPPIDDDLFLLVGQLALERTL
ncbi:MAG: Phosphate-selective porin [bacterium]|nr:Phosphate-selective porin [bacterium]